MYVFGNTLEFCYAYIHTHTYSTMYLYIFIPAVQIGILRNMWHRSACCVLFLLTHITHPYVPRYTQYTRTSTSKLNSGRHVASWACCVVYSRLSTNVYTPIHTHVYIYRRTSTSNLNSARHVASLSTSEYSSCRRSAAFCDDTTVSNVCVREWGRERVRI